MNVGLFAFRLGALFDGAFQFARGLRFGRGLLEKVPARGAYERDEAAPAERFEKGRAEASLDVEVGGSGLDEKHSKPSFYGGECYHAAPVIATIKRVYVI